MIPIGRGSHPCSTKMDCYQSMASSWRFNIRFSWHSQRLRNHPPPLPQWTNYHPRSISAYPKAASQDFNQQYSSSSSPFPVLPFNATSAILILYYWSAHNWSPFAYCAGRFCSLSSLVFSTYWESLNVFVLIICSSLLGEASNLKVKRCHRCWCHLGRWTRSCWALSVFWEVSWFYCNLEWGSCFGIEKTWGLLFGSLTFSCCRDLPFLVCLTRSCGMIWELFTFEEVRKSMVASQNCRGSKSYSLPCAKGI